MDNLIYETIINMGYSKELSTLIVAQARYETNDYKSNVFKDNNNLFGYKYVGQNLAKKGTLTPKKEWNNNKRPEYYAKYTNYGSCIRELIGWLRRRQNEELFKIEEIFDSTSYATALKKGNYYGISILEYKKGLDSKLTKLIKLKNLNYD